jgi:arylsulfatase A
MRRPDCCGISKGHADMRLWKAILFSMAGIVLLLFLPAAMKGLHQGKTEHSEKPNIIIILADDLGYGDIGGYYGGKAKTPNLNTLAHEGMLFTDFHSNGPMCSPTRAALLTGRYQNRMGIETALPGQWEETGKGAVLGISSPENIKEKSIADYLREAGYTTGFFGKWHLGNHPDANPLHYGFDEFRGLTSGCGDYFSKLDRFGYRDWWHNDKLEFQEGYTTDVITDNGIEFIKKNKQKPFFVYLAHLGVHFPWQRPEDGKLEVRREGEDFTSNYPGPGSKLGPHTPEKVPDVLSEMIESVDANVGRLIAFLKSEGLDKNTIVFFTADNGQYLNYQEDVWPNVGSNGILRGEKSDLYEGGHRVPAMVWWPGKIAPLSVSHHTFMTFDLLPTMLDVLNLPVPPAKHPNQLDGVSMLPVWINSEDLMPQRTLFWRTPGHKAARKGPWKLLQTREGANSELYHLAQDISESNNLIDVHPEMLDVLTSELTAWEKEIDYK